MSATKFWGREGLPRISRFCWPRVLGGGQEGGVLLATNSGVLPVTRFWGHEGLPRTLELCRSRILSSVSYEFWSTLGHEDPLRRAEALYSSEVYRHTCESILRRSRMMLQNADCTVSVSDASTIAATPPASIIVEIAAMQDVHMNVIVAALRFGPLDDAFREGRQCLERL